MDSEFVDWKSTSDSVIPVDTGSRRAYAIRPYNILDTGLHLHDQRSLRLKARDFNHPPNGTLGSGPANGIR